MLKHRIKIISLIILLIISLSFSVVKAENETSTNEATTNESTSNEAVPISETQQDDTFIKDGDEYIINSSDVTINYPVDGNVFIIASTVNINSPIGGDAFIIANTININENGYILSNLFSSSTDLNIKGRVYNVYSIADTVRIDGFIYRDLKTVCNSLTINSMIGRDAYVSCSNINFKEKPAGEESSIITSYGTIQGDLTYFSNKELTFPDGAIVGSTNFTQLSNKLELDFSDYMYSLGTVLVSAIVIWLIVLWISPKLALKNSLKNISLKKALQIIGLGILVPILLAIISIIILLIPIASKLSILLILLLIILLLISKSIAIVSINNVICNKFNVSQSTIKLGFLILTALVIWLLTLIPYFGIVVSLVAVIWGIGIISYKLLIKENVKDNSTDNTKKLDDNNSKKLNNEKKDNPKKNKKKDTSKKDDEKDKKSDDINNDKK